MLEDLELERHLSVLFPGYAGDGQDLLTTLTEEELKRAFRRMALDCHPDRAATLGLDTAHLRRDRFVEARRAFEALRPFARRAAQSGGQPGDVSPLESEPAADPRIVAVGGAKGGVGKSTLAASLAAALGMMGLRVVAVDLDLGGSDLHYFLGIRRPERSIGHLWANQARDLAGLAEPTAIRSLSLISGDSSCLGSANIRHSQKRKLISGLRRLPADLVVLDLGGDTTFNTLDFFLAAHERLVVTTADPASVLDAYNFVKVGLLRWLGNAAFPRHAQDRVSRFVAGSGKPGGPSVSAFIGELAALDPTAGAAMKSALAAYRPRLVLNQSDAGGGKEVLDRIRQVCRQHLGIEVELCHLIPQDPEILRATRRLGNVISLGHEGSGTRAIWALASKLAEPSRRKLSAFSERAALASRFFQPPWLFDLLPRGLAGAVRRALGSGEALHAWVLGCGGGESAYSLAIALEEMAPGGKRLPYRVWATGENAAETEDAMRGVYPQTFLAGVRPETLKRYFLRGVGLSAGSCQIKEFIRERVTFRAAVNLGASPPGLSLDLVVSNLRAEAFALLLRGPLARSLVSCLRPGGLLIVPSWPRRDSPVPALTRVGDGVFRRTIGAAA